MGSTRFLLVLLVVIGFSSINASVSVGQAIDTYFCYNGETQYRTLRIAREGFFHQEYGLAGPGQFDVELRGRSPFDAYLYRYPDVGGAPAFMGYSTASRSAAQGHQWGVRLTPSDQTLHLLLQVTPRVSCPNCTLDVTIHMSRCGGQSGGGSSGGGTGGCPANTCWDGTYGTFGIPNCLPRSGASGGRC